MSRYLVFALVSLTLIMMSMSSTSVAVAFPVMTSTLNVSLVTAGWVLSIYQLVTTAAMPLAGKASDVLGRKNTFLLCLSLFCAGSFLCAIAPNIYFLIISRFIQGVGGGGFIPCSAGIISDHFPDKRQQAIGLFTSMGTAGQIIGPSLGGWLTTLFGWQSIFWVNVPFGIVMITWAALALRHEPTKKTSIDLVGSGLFTCSLFALMISLTTLSNTGAAISWVLIPALLLASAVFMVSFVRRSSRIENPIIDPAVLSHKPFLAANLYNFIVGGCYFGITSLAPLYAVSVYGMSTLASGLVVTPKALAMMAASTVTSLNLVTWGYRRPILAGSAVMLLTLAVMGLELRELSLPGLQLAGAALVPIVMAGIGIGMGTATPAANNACIELMPHRVATIMGIRGMFRQTGGAISVAVGTVVLNSAGDMARGFQFYCFGLAVMLLLAVPAVFLMPKSCRETPSGAVTD